MQKWVQFQLNTTHFSFLLCVVPSSVFVFTMFKVFKGAQPILEGAMKMQVDGMIYEDLVNGLALIEPFSSPPCSKRMIQHFLWEVPQYEM